MREQTETVFSALADTMGAEHVLTDEKSLALFSADLFYEGTPPAAVISPGTTNQLAGAIKAITGAGLSVVPRGGGLSYSAGYVTDQSDVVMIDTRRLNRILEINEDDMYVTVECGCTWAALNDALKEKGLRTPYYAD